MSSFIDAKRSLDRIGDDARDEMLLTARGSYVATLVVFVAECKRHGNYAYAELCLNNLNTLYKKMGDRLHQMKASLEKKEDQKILNPLEVKHLAEMRKQQSCLNDLTQFFDDKKLVDEETCSMADLVSCVLYSVRDTAVVDVKLQDEDIKFFENVREFYVLTKILNNN